MPTAERQLRLMGFEPAPRRLKRARSVKTIARAEKSAVLEDVMATSLSYAYRKSAQAWFDSRGAFSFRDTDEVVHMEAVAPEVADTIDVDTILIGPLKKAKRRHLFATSLTDRLADERKTLAAEVSVDESFTWEHLFHTYDLIGKIYHLQPETIADFRRKALAPVKKLEPRLR